MLVSPLVYLKLAKKKRFALSAFSVFSLDHVRALVETCEKLRCVCVFSVSEDVLPFLGLDYIVSVASVAASKSKVPVALHLSHARSFETVKQCVQRGFTSIGIDYSDRTLEQNIKLTKKCVSFAHDHGVCVEAELGSDGGKKDAERARKALVTSVASAKKFVQATGVDLLAVSAGQSHGAYTFMGKANLDIKHLRALSLATAVPLTLHGADELPDASLKEAVRNGVALFSSQSGEESACMSVLCSQKITDVGRLLSGSQDALREFAQSRIRLLGAKGSV